ncbi:hypothetical protein [Xylanimonas sp. McL0601]|uniref:hypothetical protein n=1 Tax=Xylanimonas sp. McL0601 TaxID=3414739 RepID=UPI003CEE609F
MTKTVNPPVVDAAAVALATAHLLAATDGDLAGARRHVADGVQCWVNDVHLDGIEPYMEGLAQFSAALEPGGLRVVAALGDDRRAVILTEHMPVGAPSPFPSARTIELDADGRIVRERVVFFDTDM